MDMPLPLAFAIEKGIESVLRLDPHLANSLENINGKVIRVDVTTPALSFHLIVVDKNVEVEGAFDAEPDTTITGSAADLLSLRSKSDALYTGAVKIEGELHTAEQLRTIIGQLDIELEDIVAPITGDAIAAQLGKFGQQLSSWFADSGNSFKQNTSEYFQEEAKVTAPNSEVERFCVEVGEVRQQCDRLSARLAVLEKANSVKATSGDD